MNETPQKDHILAAISCTHGNLPALTAVLEDLADRGIKQAIHLGDSVGYGPNPEETVQLLRDRDIRSIQGCWDKSIADGDDDCGCEFVNEEEAERGRQVFQWTAARVSESTRRYLGELPTKIRVKTPCGVVLFVHGSPRSANEYLPEDIDPTILMERIHSAKCDILVCGHTHIPYIHRVTGSIAVEKAHPHTEESKITQMLVDTKYVFNAGSVGEPLYGPEASYLVMDLNTGVSEIVYVPYDIDDTIQRMKDGDVPPFVIDRFRENMDITIKDRSCLC